MFNVLKRKPKIKVYFICQYMQGFNKICDVIFSMLADITFDVKVLAVPEDIEKFPNNENYSFWYSKFGDITINAIKDKEWFDLKKEKPDYVFIQRPYDNYLPINYHVETIKKYTKICYIPYGFELINFRKVAMPDFFVKNVSMFFCSQSEEYDYCNDIISSVNDGINRKCFDIGYPSLFNVVEKSKKYNSAFNKIDKKVNFNIIWTPRWTVDDNLCKTSFFDYKDVIVKYMKNQKDVNFIFRPHPLALKNFVNEHLMTQKQVDNYLKNFSNSNLYYDSSSDYYDTFAESDVLITDFSSIIIEYILFNKPIIYCYNSKPESTDFIKNMVNCFYCVNNWDELKETLENIKNGNDYLKKEREKFLKSFLKKYDNNVALKIIDAVKKDFSKK